MREGKRQIASNDMYLENNLPRKRRPLDVELFGNWLADTEQYARILRFVREKELCPMRDVKEEFANGSKGSTLYRQVSRLEKAKLLKIRFDGVWNYLELTPRGKDILSS